VIKRVSNLLTQCRLTLLLKGITAFLLAAVAVNLTFPRIVKADLYYLDVQADAWYFEAITQLSASSILDGFPDGSFRPTDTLTAAQFIKMVCLAALPQWLDTITEYDNWAEAYYFAALEHGLLRESEFGTDVLDEPISRYDAALLLSRAAELKEAAKILPGVSALIADNYLIPAKYAHAVQLGYSAGLIGGYEDGSFFGDNILTRAEGSTLILRLIDESARVETEVSNAPVPSAAPAFAPRTVQTEPPGASVTPKPGSSAAPQGSPAAVIDASALLKGSVFIGDSLTHGLYLYGKMKEPDYLYSTGMSVFRATDSSFDTPGGNSITLSAAFTDKNYTAVYLLFGVNELGAYVGDFEDAYSAFIDTIRELCPDATIYIQSLLPVSKKKDADSKVFTKERVTLFNDALRELAADKDAVFLDVNAVFADDKGFLPASSTWDGVHLNSGDYVRWAKFVRGNLE
jgi:lysophospholipase L1-like esterase